MKYLKRLIAFASIAAVFTFNALADDLASLQGTWSAKNTRDGQSYTQTLEIKQGAFKFKVLPAEGEAMLYAEGKIRLEKSGPFNVLKFVDITAGKAAGDLSSINDDYVSIYVLGDNTLTVAANFDKNRDGQKPNLSVYIKVTK